MPENQEQNSKQKKDTQSRSYCLTVNNYETKNFSPQDLEKILKSIPSMQYYIFSIEKATTGTPHLQGYFHAKNAIRFSTLKRKFDKVNPHIETAKGSAQENRDYVTKSGKWADTEKADTNSGIYYEWGTMPRLKGKGKRTDWTEVREMVLDNKSNLEIIEAFPHMIPHMRKIDDYRNEVLETFIDSQKEKKILENWIIFGEPELGKSTFAWNSAPRSEIYTVTNNLKPFDSFIAGKHTTIIYDEFDDNNYNIRDVNQWFDRFYQKFHCRYYDRWLTQTRNIIITNKKPEIFWEDIQKYEPLVWRAFCRRITKVFEFYELGKYLEYNGMNKYLNRNEHFHPATEATPFDTEPKPQQLNLSQTDDTMPFD